MNVTAPRASRPWPLLLLVMAVVAPSLIATGLYVSGWRPAASSSHGELITPPQPLPGMSLTGADGTPLDTRVLRGKWSLLYLLPQNCATECRNVLLALRMVHVAQGREYGRVQRVLVTEAGTPVAMPTETAALLQDGLRLSTDAASAARLRAALASSGGSAGEIHLVDPMGNLVLRYRPDSDPKGMRKDLAHLLKHSWIG